MIKKVLKNSGIMFLVIAISFLITSVVRSQVMFDIKPAQINKYYKQNLPTNPVYNSIIKFAVNESLCSAVVIDANYALTASHCVTDYMGSLTESKLTIITSDGAYLSNKAIAVASDKYRDVALIKGDFNNFNYSDVDFDGKRILNIHNLIVLSCGFPGGANLFCSEQQLSTNSYFRLSGYGGVLQKGMSGGPVFDEATKEVIGINSAVDTSTNLFGPIVGIKEEFGI